MRQMLQLKHAKWKVRTIFIIRIPTIVVYRGDFPWPKTSVIVLHNENNILYKRVSVVISWQVIG